MSQMLDHSTDVFPSATPSTAELEAWAALPQDEQLRRLRASFADPACSRIVPDTMADLLNQARAAVKPSNG